MPPDLADSGPTGAARLLVLGPAELIGAAGQAAPSAALQSKRLLLLTYLALEGSHAPVRRDKLLALFWPELDDEHARHALRQAIHQLRASLPEGAIISRGEAALGIDPALLWCDAVVLQEEGDQLGQGVAELYRGDLLDGVHAGGTSPELEQWLDQARDELRVRAAAIGWAAAGRAEEAGDASGAIVLATWAGERDPEDERAARRQMRLLARHGDRAAALRLYEALAAHLARELDAEPDPETQALADEIRRVEYQRATPPPSAASGAAGAGAGPWDGLERRTDVASPGPAPRRPRWPFLVGLVAIATSVAVALGLRNRATAIEDWPIVAVGQVDIVRRPGGDSLLDPATVSGVLATDLARMVGVHVLSQARVFEFLPRGGGLSTAARRAGADDLIEGRLIEQPDGRLRLELRRVDARRGVIRDAFAAEGANVFDAVSAATARVADLYGAAVPSVPIGLLTSRSLVAQRRYQEGLRALAQYDYTAARAAFLAALEQDSTFTAAAYHAALLSTAERPRLGRLVEQAAAAADSAPDRERLQIRYLLADLTNDPRVLIYAESLAARFPAEPEGHVLLAGALNRLGDFSGAIRELERALAIDTALGPATPGMGCRSCEALRLMTAVYQVMDSLAAAERVARRLLATTDSAPIGAHFLASVVSSQGRHAEALDLLEQVWPDLRRGHIWTQAAAEVVMRAGDLRRADSLLSAVGTEGGWDRAIVLRTEGRYGEALELAHAGLCTPPRQHAGRTPAPSTTDQDLCDMARSLSHAALGDPARAARILDSAVRRPDPVVNLGRGQHSRRRAWFFALAGVAWADAGDTTRLAAWADSSEYHGRRSAYGRDRRVHHHLRGVLALARGDTARAEANLRASVWSFGMGYGRTTLALAELLLRTGRPQEAYAMADLASRGQVSAMGSHTTLTDMHAMAARAAHQAGWPDVAARHAEWAVAAWANADPAIQPRRDSLRAYLRPPSGTARP